VQPKPAYIYDPKPLVGPLPVGGSTYKFNSPPTFSSAPEQPIIYTFGGSTAKGTPVSTSVGAPVSTSVGALVSVPVGVPVGAVRAPVGVVGAQLGVPVVGPVGTAESSYVPFGGKFSLDKIDEQLSLSRKMFPS
jgi:hypothetical protein